jgi:hypothetical protein
MIISFEKVEKWVDPFGRPAEEGGLYYDHSGVRDGNAAPEIKTGNIERQQMKKFAELVNHPRHYNTGKIEVIDAIMDWGLDFIEGNVVKYVARSKHKSSRVGDLKKARWYLDYLIDKLEKE